MTSVKRLDRPVKNWRESRVILKAGKRLPENAPVIAQAGVIWIGVSSVGEQPAAWKVL
jgi:hypothetical protein